MDIEVDLLTRLGMEVATVNLDQVGLDVDGRNVVGVDDVDNVVENISSFFAVGSVLQPKQVGIVHAEVDVAISSFLADVVFLILLVEVIDFDAYVHLAILGKDVDRNHRAA